MPLVRVNEFVLNAVSRPVAGASVAVLNQPANTSTQPGSPLASIFLDSAGTQASPNPLNTDGLGNFFFYAAPGTYTLQIWGNGIPTQIVIPDKQVALLVNVSSGTGGQFASGLGADGNLIYSTPTVSTVSAVTNSQTGTTYTVLNTDQGKLVTFNNASAIAVTLPQAGAGSAFLSGWFAYFENKGAGTVTITPATSTIDGASSITLAQNSGVMLFSDGTNYSTMRGQKSSISASSGAAHQFANAIDGSGNLSYAQPSAADLSDTKTGTGSIVLASAPTIANPSITGTAGLSSSGVVAFNSDTGLSRTAAGAAALGNGTAGDTSGTLALARVFQAVGNANVTPVTVTGTTSQTSLQTVTTLSGELNAVGRWIKITARGTESTGATPGTLTIKLAIGATNLITLGAYTLTASQTNQGWWFEFDIMVTTAGASGALQVGANTVLNNVSNSVNAFSNASTVTGINLTGTVTFTLSSTATQTATSVTSQQLGYVRCN